MGDVSIIARRLAPDVVQYGWSGNGGYCRNVGLRLLEWYNTKDDAQIDYLFDLGQTALIGKPGSEKGGAPILKTHDPTGQPFWVGRSERDIFNRIAFVDYGYFYDTDKKWHYVVPGPFRIKIPLELVANNLDEEGYEFAWRSETERKVVAHILSGVDGCLDGYLGALGLERNAILTDVLSQKHPVHTLFEHYKHVWEWFDDWVVVRADDDMKEIAEIIARPYSGTHEETCYWTGR